MKQNTEAELVVVDKEGKKEFVIEQKTSATLDVFELIKQDKQMQMTIKQIEQERDKIKKALEDKKFEKELEELESNLLKHIALRESVVTALEEHKELIIEPFKKELIAKRAESGLKDSMKQDEKFQLKNRIMSSVIENFNKEKGSYIDRGDAMIHEAGKDVFGF